MKTKKKPAARAKKRKRKIYKLTNPGKRGNARATRRRTASGYVYTFKKKKKPAGKKAKA